MGSRAKVVIAQGFHTVGKGNEQFLNISNVTKFIQFLIFKGFINENMRGLEEKKVITYLTLGNVANLIDSRCQVFCSI